MCQQSSSTISLFHNLVPSGLKLPCYNFLSLSLFNSLSSILKMFYLVLDLHHSTVSPLALYC